MREMLRIKRSVQAKFNTQVCIFHTQVCIVDTQVYISNVNTQVCIVLEWITLFNEVNKIMQLPVVNHVVLEHSSDMKFLNCSIKSLSGFRS